MTSQQYWQKKLPDPLKLKTNGKGYWWVDGYCGYRVAFGDTAKQAATRAMAECRKSPLLKSPYCP